MKQLAYDRNFPYFTFPNQLRPAVKDAILSLYFFTAPLSEREVKREVTLIRADNAQGTSLGQFYVCPIPSL